MSQNQLKKLAALKALEYVKPNSILGIGSGSTVNIFIAELGKVKDQLNLQAVVAASKASEKLLQEQGFKVIQPDQIDAIELYIDGADEVNHDRETIKGGGAALTREKVLVSLAKQFICVVDKSKLVNQLGAFPLPIEVVPFATSRVIHKVQQLIGGTAKLRENLITDNFNQIIDVSGLLIENPAAMEKELNNIPGIVTNGIFALKTADLVIVAQEDEIIEF